MRRLYARIISYVMIAALGISLWSPMGATQVSAEGNTAVSGDNVDNPDTKESYKIVLQDSTGNEVKDFSTSDNGELNLASFIMKVMKTEDGSTEEVLTEGTQFTYISSNPEIATVSDEGKITVVDGSKDDSEIDVTIQWTGEASETGQEAPKAELKISVTITKLSAKSIEIVETDETTGNKTPLEEKTLIVKDTFDLSQYVKVDPAGAAKTLVYTSSDPDIVEVNDDGVLTAKGTGQNRTGTAVITVSANNAEDSEETVQDTITVTVMDIPVALELNQTAYSMKATDSFQLSAELIYTSGDKEPVGANKLDFIVSDADKNVISVDENGLVTGREQTTYPAKATVIVYYQPEYDLEGKKPESITKSCEITITKIPIEKIEITNKAENRTLKINETFPLKTEVSPANATDKTISYKTSDKDVAKVSSDGKITATGIGEATITAYAKENSEIKDTFVVKVYQTTFNIAELGVDGTDQKNDAADINKILKYATLIDGMITVIIPDGTYYIGSTLKVYTETNIQLSTNAVIKRMQSAEGKTMLTNRTSEDPAKGGGYIAARDIIISGGTWDGNAVGNDHSNLLYFGHASNITIKNTTIKNDGGAHLIEFTGVQNAVVENVNLTGFVTCKTLTASQNAEKEAIQIDHCTGETNAPGMAPFDGTACDNITIRNCNISGYMAGIGTHTQGSNPSTNILIENNTFDNITNACINLRKFKNVTVRNNVATNCTTFIYASEAQGLVENNTMNMGTAYVPVTTSGLRAKNGITVSNGSNFVIRNNTIENAKSNGICVWNGSTAEIKKNKIKNNLLYGIRTQGSTVTLKKNTLSSNKKGLYDTYKDATIKSSDDIRAYYINIKKKYKYKGKAVKPKITIKGLNKKYYKVTYKNNKKPGTATVTITGKKGVKKSLKIKFKITKK